ncbi:hypothetical protein DL764_009858 [Monosporascus ibericus]|uniref:Uncharacterized protein n=1 Tax=Monosporascus ibericus TaxID=155417 RepID=A0A4Q4STW6_9PEZI|nr:hypothetical protein DL764_009858 [Monosporascus ibericus]
MLRPQQEAASNDSGVTVVNTFLADLTDGELIPTQPILPLGFLGRVKTTRYQGGDYLGAFENIERLLPQLLPQLI